MVAADIPPPLDPHPLSAYVSWAGHRNRDPILKILKDKFASVPEGANGEISVLEMATGSGMHLTYFAPNFPNLTFYPSEKDGETFENIRKLTKEKGCTNVKEPVVLDLTKPDQIATGTPSCSAIFCINIFQVAPIEIADGMMQCAKQLLKQGGLLMIYGPFQKNGSFTTESNASFHAKIFEANSKEWGLKDIADLDAAAVKHGLIPEEVVDMPANNFMLIYKKP